MTFQIVQGDLFDPEFGFDALAQGVNTQGLMGAGIAVAFKNNWPDMYEDYKERCTQFGPSLGGLVHIWRSDVSEIRFTPDSDGLMDFDIDFDDVTIYNMFSQIMPGRSGDYRLLQQAAITVLLDAEEMGYESVGLPWIGCGIAGLEKHNVEHIFKAVFASSDTDFILVQQDEIHEPVV
jgi:O-acetyl-ADP-ribose deacetylase (regulator of RNase III)